MERTDEAVKRLLTGYGRRYATLPSPGLLLALQARVQGFSANHLLVRLKTEFTRLLP